MGKKGRVFLRGMSSEQYGLKEFREEQLAAPRVRDDEIVVDDAKRRPFRRLGGLAHVVAHRPGRRAVPDPEHPGPLRRDPGRKVEPRARAPERGGLLHPPGQRLRDPRRQALHWEQGDVAVVHTDSVHRHFNDGEETAKCLVIKAKSTWMYFNLIQQGRSGPIEDEERTARARSGAGSGPPGVDERTKVVKSTDGHRWETTRDGRIRVICSADTRRARVLGRPLRAGDPARLELGEAPTHGRRGRLRDLRARRVAAVGGRGGDRRALLRAGCKEPTSRPFMSDDTVYVPQNHVHQYVNTGDEPLRL